MRVTISEETSGKIMLPYTTTNDGIGQEAGGLLPGYPGRTLVFNSIEQGVHRFIIRQVLTEGKRSYTVRTGLLHLIQNHTFRPRSTEQRGRDVRQ